MWGFGGASCLAVGVLLALPAATAGSVVKVDARNTIRIEDSRGEANGVTIGREGDEFVISDSAGMQTTCPKDPDSGAAHCSAPMLPPAKLIGISVDLREGADSLVMLHGVRLPTVIDAGAGNDTLAGDAEEDVLGGGFGDDFLSGGDNQDDLLGGSGRDVLRPGAGTDPVVDGGPGFDRVSYADGGAGVAVSLGAGRNDGAPGERDRVTGVEAVRGTGFADLLEGSARHNMLAGGHGADTLLGRGGPDLIRARDGRHDTVDCGGGVFDVAVVDRVDRVRGCETVR
jgi:Ca2+-binding RTX toxin-like protein